MLPKYLKSGFRGGYRRTSFILNSAFNIALALILITLCAPLYVIISIVMLFRDGRPIIYRGARLGQGRRVFEMYKFRTLVNDADKLIGAQLLTSRHRLLTPSGRFLRETRLDELPQLINILKGDMDFVGPRPERPEIYEHICKHIPYYDKRFTVKPGLIGYSQVFTPHGAPKRMRALLDNRLVEKKQRLFWEVYAVALTGFMVLRTVAIRAFRNFYRDVLRSRLLRQYDEKRRLERVAHRRGTVLFTAHNGGEELAWEMQLIDINDEAFLMRSVREAPEPFPTRFVLQVYTRSRTGRLRRKRAVCEGELYRRLARDNDHHEYVVTYRPMSPLNYYMVHQYFLLESVA